MYISMPLTTKTPLTTHAAYLDPAKHMYSETDLKQLHETFGAEGHIKRSLDVAGRHATENEAGGHFQHPAIVHHPTPYHSPPTIFHAPFVDRVQTMMPCRADPAGISYQLPSASLAVV